MDINYLPHYLMLYSAPVIAWSVYWIKQVGFVEYLTRFNIKARETVKLKVHCVSLWLFTSSGVVAGVTGLAMLYTGIELHVVMHSILLCALSWIIAWLVRDIVLDRKRSRKMENDHREIIKMLDGMRDFFEALETEKRKLEKGLAYVIQKKAGVLSITCLTCGKTSYSPGDIKNRYCGYCNKYHSDINI
jgi:hypothetical protein